MVQELTDSQGTAFGFKIAGDLTAADIADLSPRIERFITEKRRPIGLLADLREMHGASWAARWHEMRFLQAHTNQLARISIVSDDPWLEFSEMVLIASAALQAETLYFHSAELQHAWHWARLAPLAEDAPRRTVLPGKGLFKDYTPEYMGI